MANNTPHAAQHGEAVKTGLIMEGGAMRGLFTCGVMDVLMENGIRFDGAAGVSAGAVFGSNYKSKQIGRPRRYNKRFCRDPRYGSLRSLLKTGDLYDADFCYRELPDVLDLFDSETFKSNPMEFYVGATDAHTGQCLYHKCTDGGETDIQWMRASASMPLVSRPVAVDGHLLLDGAISDSVPFAFMESLGYNRNVIVLTQPAGYVKRKSAALPLMRLLLRRYPAVVQALAVRHEMYNQQMAEIKRCEEAGTSFVIRPAQTLGIRRTENNPDELERVYQLGRAEAEKNLAALQGFLGA